MQRTLSPNFQLIEQTSANTQAGYSSQYTSFSIGLSFILGKDISLEMTTSIG
ncbi:hypothetical protein ND861_18670 [Leptospira sp. 2 VSF19]|uniref:Uncharacterized protein n=1 Tax=Leptospira soteropolitanensis TaxID=2950025 RepID=A0ABT3MNB7_9LEPT|nr:hypothetical protein [Leptospira soteropolitanensis]MCW7494683.1 hypothetical protein [Leptospira soteropolitanensis]MCW7528388.1 hypothetical protein [Leptospira soteropolitanensis]